MALKILMCLCLGVLPALSDHGYTDIWSQGVIYDGFDMDSVVISEFDHSSHITKRDQEFDTEFEDDHNYYTSTYIPPGEEANDLWVDLTMEDSVDSAISDKFRFYVGHELPFEFPFYGHIINFVAIATGGFLYTGTILHPFIHLTQFIAPLQADFNANITDESRILILGTPERFTVQWDQMHNHDHIDAGVFTFQVSLFPSGEIHFVYREVPLLVSEIDNDDHPVEVGLADAFYFTELYFDPVLGPVLNVTIYEYHRIQLNASNNLTFSAYKLIPLPNCINGQSCEECVRLSDTTDFTCGWCDALDRCSDGIDRHRQDWVESGCHETATTECPISTTSLSVILGPTAAVPTTTSTPVISGSTTVMSTSLGSQATYGYPPSPTNTPPFGGPGSQGPGTGSESSKQKGLSTEDEAGIAIGIIVLLALAVLVLVVCAVLVYGYRRPTSKLGMFMIEHRPKARRLNRTSASYNVEVEKTVLEDQ